MPTVLIIGTSHRYQRRTPDVPANVIDEFSEYLRQSVEESNAAAIAEEMSGAALEENGLPNSVAQMVSSQLGIPHLLADPSPEEREQLGIRQRNEITCAGFFADLTTDEIEAQVRQSYDIRETYWLTRLAALDVYPVIFICGAAHVEPFRDKLLVQGHDAAVLSGNWVPRDGA